MWFPYVVPQIPADAADTKGKSISWKAPSITFDIYRGATYEETENGVRCPWKRTAEVPTLAMAKKCLEYWGNNETPIN